MVCFFYLSSKIVNHTLNLPCCKVVSDKLYLRLTLCPLSKPNISKASRKYKQKPHGANKT